MDLETATQAFASAGNDLPREAMQWALDHWDEAAPELLSVLERYTSGADRSDEAARAVLFILHLAGEKQDTRVFPLLCRLAQDCEAIEAALGDGITTTFKRILISTYDGDLDTLKGLIEAAEADPHRPPGGVAGRFSQHGEAAAVDEVDRREVDHQHLPSALQRLQQGGAGGGDNPEIQITRETIDALL